MKLCRFVLVALVILGLAGLPSTHARSTIVQRLKRENASLTHLRPDFTPQVRRALLDSSPSNNSPNDDDNSFTDDVKNGADNAKDKADEGYSWWKRQSKGVRVVIVVLIILAVLSVISVIMCVCGCAKTLTQIACCPCVCLSRMCRR